MYDQPTEPRSISTDHRQQGASPREQILGACRTDNLELYNEVKKSMGGKSKEEIAKFYNEIVDSMGNHLLHICAAYGSCEQGHPCTVVS